MKHQVTIISIELIGENEGTIIFRINNHDYSAFFHGNTFPIGETIIVDLTYLAFPLGWETIFHENMYKELKLEKNTDSEWHYNGYGKVLSINPVIIDFGDIKLEPDISSNDSQIIGEYVFCNIERLEISRSL